MHVQQRQNLADKMDDHIVDHGMRAIVWLRSGVTQDVEGGAYNGEEGKGHGRDREMVSVDGPNAWVPTPRCGGMGKKCPLWQYRGWRKPLECPFH